MCVRECVCECVCGGVYVYSVSCELRPRHSRLLPPFAALLPSATAFSSSSHVWRPLGEGAGTPVERGGERGGGKREGEGEGERRKRRKNGEWERRKEMTKPPLVIITSQ